MGEANIEPTHWGGPEEAMDPYTVGDSMLVPIEAAADMCSDLPVQALAAKQEDFILMKHNQYEGPYMATTSREDDSGCNASCIWRL